MFEASCVGNVIGQIIIVGSGASNDSDNFLQYTLDDVIVSHYSASGINDSDNNSKPMETLNLNYSKIELKYVPCNSDNKPLSPIRAGYDISTASKLVSSALLSQYFGSEVSKAIARSAIVKFLFRTLPSTEFTLLSAQGILYKASAASGRLQKKYPVIFMEMRNKDLDIFYFILEKPMEEYMNAIRMLRMRLPVNLVGMV